MPGGFMFGAVSVAVAVNVNVGVNVGVDAAIDFDLTGTCGWVRVALGQNPMPASTAPKRGCILDEKAELSEALKPVVPM
jgi:hypothetical protein